MTPKKSAGEPAKNEMSFEQALERLEKIVHDMEMGSLSLEAMMERFEEGQKLIRSCSTKLNEVERKIEILVKKDGETVAEPFEQSVPEAPPTSDNDELF